MIIIIIIIIIIMIIIQIIMSQSNSTPFANNQCTSTDYVNRLLR